jgi:hypothetical protein
MNGELVSRWLQFGQLFAGVLIFTAGALQYAFSHPFRRERNLALAFLAKGVNGLLVITTIVLLVTNSMRPSAAFSGLRIVRAGLITFASFVLFEDIVNDCFLNGGWNVEWVGVLALLGCLGYVAVSRAVENDRQLRDLQRELETACQIQTSTLPQWMPAIDGDGESRTRG